MSIHDITLVAPCPKCTSLDGLFADVGANTSLDRFMLSCENCGCLIATSNDMVKMAGLFLIGRVPKPVKTQPHAVASTPKRFSPTGRIRAPAAPPAPSSKNQGTAAILRAFQMAFGTKKNYGPPVTAANKAVKKSWRMKEAYEANKKSATCVICGEQTAYHPSVSVLYCKCVESLPK